MEADRVSSAIKNHLQAFFVGHTISEFEWPLGPIQEVLPHFRVLRVSPGSRCNLWVYVSSGAWDVDRDQQSGLEFMIFAHEESPRHVELLAMSAHYHLNHDLDLGHTYPIGEPWLEGSACDHMLVSLPYPFGEELELCEVDEGHIHLYWLLPITLAERQFKATNGLEALEQLFEDRELEYWRADRPSVV
jgi:suppressor of fused protein SUFU